MKQVARRISVIFYVFQDHKRKAQGKFKEGTKRESQATASPTIFRTTGARWILYKLS